MRSLEARYAQALFELVRDEETLKTDAKVMMETPALWQVLCHPGIAAEEKSRLIDRGFRETPAVLRGFYKLLCQHERVALLPEIVHTYHGLCLQVENAMDAVMRCAFPPTDEDKARLEKMLCRLHGKGRVNLWVQKEPELLGGFIIEAGTVTYDRSVRGALRGLGNSLKAR